MCFVCGREHTECIDIELEYFRSVQDFFRGGLLPFCKKPDQDEPQNQPLARFKLGSGAKERLAVLIPGKSKSGMISYQIMMLNISPHALGSGERYAINLSKLPVAIRFGHQTTAIAPSAIQKIKLPKGKNGDFVPVTGKFKSANKWEVFMSSRWVRSDRVRSILFIYPETKTKTLSWHGVEIPTSQKNQTP